MPILDPRAAALCSDRATRLDHRHLSMPHRLNNPIASHRRPLAPARQRPLRFEPLEDRRVMADIRLNTFAVIERDTPANATTPVIGEQICVRANYQTIDLPAGSAYRIDYKVDG